MLSCMVVDDVGWWVEVVKSAEKFLSLTFSSPSMDVALSLSFT